MTASMRENIATGLTLALMFAAWLAVWCATPGDDWANVLVTYEDAGR